MGTFNLHASFFRITEALLLSTMLSSMVKRKPVQLLSSLMKKLTKEISFFRRNLKSYLMKMPAVFMTD
jgi:hypothetical protein